MTLAVDVAGRGSRRQWKGKGGAGMGYENALTATTKIIDKFHAESGSDNTLLTNYLGVEVKMSDKVAPAGRAPVASVRSGAGRRRPRCGTRRMR